MAIYIKIRKFIHEKENVFYEIDLAELNLKLFVKIDVKNNLLTFYKSNNFDRSFLEVDLRKNNVVHTKEIPANLMYRIITQLAKAIKRNEFPDVLDYSA